MKNIGRKKIFALPGIYQNFPYWLRFSAPLLHPTNKKGLWNIHKPLIFMARPARFELATYGFVVGQSIKNKGNNK
ncbi:hypothetical protein [Desulfonema limicola]|uniref:hypothetical protein n=1 Tax=Desulfonema limicola TaxID=45656 RepID=UPI001A9A7327|nr:hypothetical protein [Desulfonema limicola]